MCNPENFRCAGPLIGTRILVVDDVADERALLASYLHSLGCRVYLAGDGQDAVQKALVVKPDIILMDLHMPLCDGLTACRLLQDNPATRETPVIFLSGAAQPVERVAGLRAGAVDYITKPFDLEEVKLRLSIHLRDQPPPEFAPDAVATGATATTLDQVLFMSARQLLLGEISSNLDTATLARRVNCNPRRLNEAFRQCVGLTVGEYQREERMKQARYLLAETRLEVQAIANELGFTNGANFATAFKERFGISPTEYRRSCSALKSACS